MLENQDPNLIADNDSEPRRLQWIFPAVAALAITVVGASAFVIGWLIVLDMV